jgi:hypothetical protein
LIAGVPGGGCVLPRRRGWFERNNDFASKAVLMNTSDGSDD